MNLGSGTGEGRRPRPVRWLMAVERGLSVVLLAAVLSLMAAQVAARYLFNAPIPWSEELARFALIWLAFMAAAFVMGEGGHITVDLVSSRLPWAGRMAIECVSSAVVLSACLMLLLPGFHFARQLSQVKSPALGLPMSWWYWAALAGFALLAVHSLINLFLAFRSGTLGKGPGQKPSGEPEAPQA